MNIPESQDPRDTAPSTVPPCDPAPKREFGAMKGELAIPDEFFDPLPPEELALWEQEIATHDPSYRIDLEGNTIVVRIRRDALGSDLLPALLAWLTIRSKQREGPTSDEEIDEVLSVLNPESADCLRWWVRNHPPDPLPSRPR